MRIRNCLPLIFLITIFSACVSTDKYNELVQVKQYLEEENKRLSDLQGENTDVRAELTKANAKLNQANAKIAELQSTIGVLNQNYEALAVRYNGLIADNRNVGTGGASEKQFWEEELAKKQLEIEQKEREIQTLRFTIGQKENRIQELLQLVRSKSGGGN